jgi:hypothetical protein
VTVEGLDFLPSTAVTITVQSPLGRAGIFQAQITSDASGEIASTDIANYATVTLTLTAVPLAAETVTLGSKTYTWRATVAATANEVLIGGTAAISLDNLKSAVNLDGNTAVYGSSTTINADIRAGAKTATTILFIAKVGGTGGNSLASTETIVTGGAFGGATLSGGAAGSGLYDFAFSPTAPGIWVISGTDGTNSATTSVVVSQGS